MSKSASAEARLRAALYKGCTQGAASDRKLALRKGKARRVEAQTECRTRRVAVADLERERYRATMAEAKALRAANVGKARATCASRKQDARAKSRAEQLVEMAGDDPGLVGHLQQESADAWLRRELRARGEGPAPKARRARRAELEEAPF